MKKILCTFFYFHSFLFSLLLSQVSFHQLDSLMRDNAKPVIIYIYSNHCAYCSIQEKQLSGNKILQNTLGYNFYFLTLNSSFREDIFFNGNHYKNNTTPDTNGIHDLVLSYTPENTKPLFPCWLFFNSKYELLFRYDGLILSTDLLLIITSLYSF